MASITDSVPAVAVGFVTVVVGFTSSAAIVFQAAKAAGANSAEVASWILFLGVGIGITTIVLSLRYRSPMVMAWSTPGAALLVTSVTGMSMGATIGAFLFAAALTTICGLTGWFERAMDRVPVPLASALLAGVLVRFGINAFAVMHTSFAIVFPMFAVYLLCRRLLPRYAIMAALAVGVIAAVASGDRLVGSVHLALAHPVFVMPVFSWQAFISVAIPLFVVTMASQNIPGVAAIRGSGYLTPISPLITWSGITTMILAPFGCFSVNLSTIGAAVCMGEEAHKDPAKRYLASISAGVFFLLFGAFGATIVALLAALPPAMVVGIAGLALLGTIGNAMTAAMRDDRMREAALVTFLATASGASVFGVSSAFWGLLAGVLVILVFHQRRARHRIEEPAEEEPVSAKSKEFR